MKHSLLLLLPTLLLMLAACGDDGQRAPTTPTVAAETPTAPPERTRTGTATITPTVAPSMTPTATTTRTPTAPPSRTPTTMPTSTLTPTANTVSHDGRWLTDADGRVLLLHGVNFVAKHLETPAERGFGDDDAAWLADNGFDAVRLGFSPDALLPAPGVINTAYIDSFVATADILRAHGLRVLVDLHQDGWGPATFGNGFPEWMTLTHGAQNTPMPFPLYYINNPAIQVAFESFWANELGPEAVPLQDRVAAVFSAFAAALAANPNILGYDMINEPWPGTNWVPCLFDAAGCPDQDHGSLDPYYARLATAIREQDPTHLLFGEPFVLFNFGQPDTSIRLPGDDANSGLSFHMYTTDPSLEPSVVAAAERWSATTGGALLCSEFGATRDPASIDRQVKVLDGGLIPWLWWSYDENVIVDVHQPPTEENLVTPAVDTLVRPHPVAVAGTPASHEYDLASRELRFTYSTTGPGGRTYPPGTESTFNVAPRTYPNGYTVDVTGGTVTSARNATRLTVVADAGSSEVSVIIRPADAPIQWHRSEMRLVPGNHPEIQREAPSPLAGEGRDGGTHNCPQSAAPTPSCPSPARDCR